MAIAKESDKPACSRVRVRNQADSHPESPDKGIQTIISSAKMKLKLLLMALCVCLNTVGFAQKRKADKETAQWRYEIEAAEGQAVQGNTLVKVYTYSKDKNTAMAQAGKNAVHGILFKGVAPKNEANVRIPGQKPIVTDIDAEETYKEYFTEFFKDGGKFQKYIQLVNNGIPDAGDIVKVGKKEYKVGVKVLVAKDALRKEMEAAGIIKQLGSGF